MSNYPDSRGFGQNWFKPIIRKIAFFPIKGTPSDMLVIGLAVKQNDHMQMLANGFDGYYTYFAVDGFSYGSTWRNWRKLGMYARTHGLLFIPAVAPGYIDERIRPWNGQNTRARDNGKYYQSAWENALESRPDLISVTSFNEWHEGTQIEPAIVKGIEGFTYLDYRPGEMDFYLKLTADFIRDRRSKGTQKVDGDENRLE